MWDLLDSCFAGRVSGCGIKDCLSLRMIVIGQRGQLQGITSTTKKRYWHGGNHNTPETILDESVIGSSSS